MNRDKKTGAALAEIFSLPDSKPATNCRAYIKLLALVDECEACIQLSGPRASTYSHCLTPARRCVTAMRLDDPWKLREVALSDNDLALLSVTADNLNGTLPEFEIEDEELKVVRSQLYDLRKEIGEADITAKLKSALLAEMSRLIDAVENYRVVGAPGLRRAAAEAFGQIIIEREGFLSAREAPWVAKYFTVVSRLADLAALAVMGHELALNAVDTLNRLLPPPTV